MPTTPWKPQAEKRTMMTHFEGESIIAAMDRGNSYNTEYEPVQNAIDALEDAFQIVATEPVMNKT